MEITIIITIRYRDSVIRRGITDKISIPSSFSVHLSGNLIFAEKFEWGVSMQRLAELRRQKGVTQMKLSLDMNITQKMISAYERGKNEPSIDMLKRMAAYFNTSVDYLVGFTDIKIPIDKISDNGFTAQEAELIHNFRNLSHKNKNRAEGMIITFLNM